jgi:aminoglycoside phosphotransferase (APT) family kinase protein
VQNLVLPLTFDLIPGGRSNLTYRVADAAGHAWVLRRPPLHGVLPSAHDVGREHRIISALRSSDVPVPGVVGLCLDAEVTGTPFFVMDLVPGKVIRTRADAHRLPEVERRSIAEDLVDVLATLHAVDPNEIGLGDLGPREDYVQRQLRRWHRQFEQSRTRDLPLIDELRERLSADVPAQLSPSLVHGDYRLDNLIVDRGEVRAVLDWELSALGDPRADLGTLVTYWGIPDDVRSPLPDAPTTVAGFPSPRELVRRYASVSGAELHDVDFFVAFAHWRLAVILEGVYSRFSAGAYGSAMDDSTRDLGRHVEWLAERADEMARRAGR